MASSSTHPVSESSTKHQVSLELDYTKTRKKFYKLITVYYGRQNKNFDVVQYLRGVNILRLVNHQLAEGVQPCSEYYDYYLKYELLIEDGITSLIKKREKPEDPILRYIPIDDSFDILVKIHLSIGHGKRDEMLEFMKDNYIINSTIVDLLFLSCNVCNVKCNFEYPPTSEKEKIDATKNKDFLLELRNTVYLDLINMTDRPDGLFEYLLIYVYKDSSFTLLRPLMKKCPIEISMEFLKIFLDFGPPTKFEVFVQDSEIFTQALDHLKSVSMSYCIPITDSWKTGMNSDFPTNVLRSIQEWIADTGGDNWGLGCHILQWKLNNQAICGSNNDEKNESQKYRTPYTRFFGSNVQVPFDLSNIGNVAVQNSEETNDNSFPIMDTITLEDNDKDDDEIDDPVIIEEPPQETSLYKIINTTSIQIADIESRSTNDSKMDVVEEETKPN